MTKSFSITTIFLFVSLLIAGCSPSYLVQKSERALVPINSSISSDTEMSTFIRPYKTALDEEMNRVIGFAAHALVKRSPVFETTLGNFFADACLQQARLIIKDIDFALPTTTGGMRNDLPAGDLKMSSIFELMPFENELIVVELKATDVEELVQFILETGGQPISGIKISYKDKKTTDIRINGAKLDANKTYKLLTSDYILGGGDSVKGITNPINRTVLNLKVRDALLNYIKQETIAGNQIKSMLDGRVKDN